MAAVKMFVTMAEMLHRSEDAQKFSLLLKKGTKSFEEKLWNG